MNNTSCRYDATFTCIRDAECPHGDLVSCLKLAYTELKHKKMQRHDASSIKWRNSCFYYKKRVRELEDELSNTNT